MDLDSRQLKTFLAIAQHGSIGRAAAAANLSQPALSRTLKCLESQLGVALFERRTTGMELTVYGHALLPYAKLLEVEAAHARDEIDTLRGISKGTVRVGAVASAVVLLLPGVIDRLLARWPALNVQVIEDVEDKLAMALANNDIDVAIAGPIAETEAIVRVSDHRFNDDHMVIAAMNHPLRDKAHLTVHDLLDWPWVMPPAEAAPRLRFHTLLEDHGATPPRASVETRSPHAIKALVAQTHFLAWLPQPLYRTEEAAGLLSGLPVEGMTLHRDFFVYRRRRRLVPPAVMKLLEELRA